ncbi:MAG: hypothetical protein ACKOEX_07065 [Planctomycetia bacterium]
MLRSNRPAFPGFVAVTDADVDALLADVREVAATIPTGSFPRPAGDA